MWRYQRDGLIEEPKRRYGNGYARGTVDAVVDAAVAWATAYKMGSRMDKLDKILVRTVEELE